MNKPLGWRMILIAAVIAVSVWMAVPLEKINLGLDLKGGMHLILEVQTEDAVRVQTDQNANQLRDLLKESGIKFEQVLRQDNNKIEMSGILMDDEGKIKDILDDEFGDWTYSFTGTKCVVRLKPNVEMHMKEQAVDQAKETIWNRVDEFGVADPVIQREGLTGNKILVQLPGVDDPERVKGLIKSTAMLEFRYVVEGPFNSRQEAMERYNNVLPPDLEVLGVNKRRMKEGGYYVLKSSSVVTGNDLKNAKSARDAYGGHAVGFSFKSQGAKKFERFTSENRGKRLSIVLDKKIESVATINDVISYDGILQGAYTREEVQDMVLVLKAGALPADIKILEERTIGPSLGADSIRKGVYAALTGLVLVMLFMLVYYKTAGVNSVVALLFNIVILIGLLASLGATLTLPGIAGIILTIGMAVDANVLVFERIKEELRVGRAPLKAIDEGFSKAFVTIFDANLTTVIAAIFLFQFGTGPIKGFSVTLILGTIASMFTAVFVSRVIFDLMYGKKKNLDKISI